MPMAKIGACGEGREVGGWVGEAVEAVATVRGSAPARQHGEVQR